MDKYEPIKVIGKGSYGDVYVVKNKQDDQDYVLKKVNLKQASAKERDAAFQEVKLMSRLQHPNVVHCIESFMLDDSLCIIMTYCEGGDLFARLQKQGTKYLPERQILEWFIQIVSGLNYLHENKIMHRDIKTQNIFLTKSNTIKLGDLGIARALDNTNEMARTIIGTPFYMSPELYNNKPYDYKSDIWALGCVLYEMTSLKHAFDAKEMSALILKVLRGVIPPIPNHFSTSLQQLSLSLLNRSSSRRPSCAGILKLPFIRKFIEAKVKEADGCKPSPNDENLDPAVAQQRQNVDRNQIKIALPKKERPQPQPSQSSQPSQPKTPRTPSRIEIQKRTRERIEQERQRQRPKVTIQPLVPSAKNSGNNPEPSMPPPLTPRARAEKSRIEKLKREQQSNSPAPKDKMFNIEIPAFDPPKETKNSNAEASSKQSVRSRRKSCSHLVDLGQQRVPASPIVTKAKSNKPDKAAIDRRRSFVTKRKSPDSAIEPGPLKPTMEDFPIESKSQVTPMDTLPTSVVNPLDLEEEDIIVFTPKSKRILHEEQETKLQDDEEYSTELSPSRIIDDTEDEQEEEEEEEVETSGVVLVGSLSFRITSLREQCIQGLGKELFDKAYQYVKVKSYDDDSYGVNKSLQQVEEELKSRVKLSDLEDYFNMISQLIFCEESL